MTKAHVIVNFVVCHRNHHELGEFVSWVHERWPGVPVNVSPVAASSDVVPKDKSMIPQYKDVMPDLVAAVREGERLGVPVLGFEAMCGVPLCVIPPEIQRKFKPAELNAVCDSDEFVRGTACKGCMYDGHCYGLRRGYMDLYGDGELRTVTGDED